MFINDSGVPPPLMASMLQFADLAASGGFEVSPDGGEALIRVIDQAHDRSHDFNVAVRRRAATRVRDS